MDQYAVFGNPIAQSKSPLIHKLFAKDTGQHLDYRAILAPVDEFADSVQTFFMQDNAKGCNVTVPFKEVAAKWVDTLSEAAHLAGAVNTISKMPDGTFHGDNTDGYGLVSDLNDNGVALKNARILLLGAGGAARGVLVPLLEQSPASLIISNRTEEKANDLADLVANPIVEGVSFNRLSAEHQSFDIVINSTSASLSGELPAIKNSFIHNAKVVYDMVYLSEPTVFLQEAKGQGVKTCIDGLGMLVGQAAQSFYIWRGVKPDAKSVLDKLREGL